MTTKEEIEGIVQFFEAVPGCAKNRLVLYNCTSGYPVPFPVSPGPMHPWCTHASPAPLALSQTRHYHD